MEIQNMKIYIKNINLNYIDLDNINIKNLSMTSNIYNYIYSDSGIFLIQNNYICKLIPNDIPCEIESFNNIDFMVDYSNYIFRKDIYNIPYNHIVHSIEKIQYRYNTDSQVSLILEKIKDKITDIYFESSEKKLSTILKGEIIKYLSLFNNIKQY